MLPRTTTWSSPALQMCPWSSDLRALVNLHVGLNSPRLDVDEEAHRLNASRRSERARLECREGRVSAEEGGGK